MAAIPATRDVTFESYLNQDEASPERLQLSRGRIVTKPPVGGRHIVFQANLAPVR